MHGLIHEMKVHGKIVVIYIYCEALKHSTKSKKEKDKTVYSSEFQLAENRAKLKTGVKELLKEIERFETQTLCQYSINHEVSDQIIADGPLQHPQ